MRENLNANAPPAFPGRARYGSPGELGVIPYAILGGLPFLIAGLWFAATEFGHVLHSMDAREWEATQATVIDLKAVETFDFEDVRYMMLVVQYRYEWNGRSYESDRIKSSVEGYYKKNAQRFLREHPVGSVLACYVNPDDPTSAVLDNSFDDGSLFSGVVALLVAALGGALVIASIFCEPGPDGEIL